MTIYEMLFREDIYGIVEKTLSQYYREVFSEDIIVKVESDILRNKFVIYPRLGIIVSRIPSAVVMMDVFKQFNVQHNLLKKIVVWAYIALCFASFGLLASRTLRLSNSKYLNRHRYIMPCNRKLRIFYYDKGYVDAILKDGFSDTYFKNEVKYRASVKYAFIPPITKYGQRWYREDILFGHGLVRVPEPTYSLGINSVLQGVKQMYEDNIQICNAVEYVTKNINYVESKLDFLKKVKNIKTTTYIQKVLNNIGSIVSDNSFSIPLVLSHGDLQTGNIFVDKKTNQVVIYDWETAQFRSIWYDMGRFLLYSQREGKYAYMVNHRNDDEIKNAILFMDDCKDYDMDVVISILVVEELVAFTLEICELPGDIGFEIMDRLTVELNQTDLFA